MYFFSVYHVVLNLFVGIFSLFSRPRDRLTSADTGRILFRAGVLSVKNDTKIS